jgi:outer membrane protein TolC
MGVVVAFLCLVGGPFQSATGQQVTIGVVTDGPGLENEIVQRVEAELMQLADPALSIRFKSVPEFDARWDATKYGEVVRNALNDPEVDMILAVGMMVEFEAVQPDLVLTKPFFSATPQRADIPHLPYSPEGRALKSNLSLVVMPQRAERDVELFQKLALFDRLHYGAGIHEDRLIEASAPAIRRFEQELDIEIIPVTITKELESSLGALDTTVQAVYLGRMPQLSREQRRLLIRELTDRGIPTFSFRGYPDVEMGALAAYTPDVTPQVVRRVALNINQVLRGTPVTDLPVFLEVESKLMINGRTAAALGYYPDMETSVTATILHPEALQMELVPLSFASALRRAEEGNWTLKISDAQLEASEGDRQKARSFLLPQIFLGASYVNNKPQFEAQIFPDHLASADVSVSQMIYDDRVISDFRSASRIRDARTFQREAIRLSILTRAGQAYLEFVLTGILVKISADNVNLTEENLDLARIRYETGYSGEDEVFRWRAELAQQRSDLLVIQGELEAQRVGLNQVLAVDQAIQWLPEEINFDPEVFPMLGGQLDNVYKSPPLWDRFRAYMVDYALANSPQLQSLASAIEAQDILLGQRKRRFFLPIFSFNFFYDYWIDRSPEVAGSNKGGYQLELRASYPLFEGAGKFADVEREKSVLDELQSQMQRARDLVERRARSSMRRLRNAFPTVKLALVGAENSLKNLEVVQNKYAQGLTNVTDLLEAQNSSFTANQAASASAYNFLQELLEFQRSVAWIEEDKTEEEKEAFLQRLSAAMQSR